jgi:mono/diheme cytochrome c family protein
VRARAVIVAVLVLALVGCSPPGRKTKEVSPLPETVIGTVAKAPTAAVKVPKGDPAAGKKLFASTGCGGCHTFKPAATNGKIGPDLDNLAADAKKADQGPLPTYAFLSIKDPTSYIVPGFQGGVMPDYGSQLSDKQIADLTAFLTQSSG